MRYVSEAIRVQGRRPADEDADACFGHLLNFSMVIAARLELLLLQALTANDRRNFDDFMADRFPLLRDLHCHIAELQMGRAATRRKGAAGTAQYANARPAASTPRCQREDNCGCGKAGSGHY